VYVTGEVQAASGAKSSEHSNVDPGSLDAKLNVALVPLVWSTGPELIVVSGDPSTVQL
jgi:hypothetical protein